MQQVVSPSAPTLPRIWKIVFTVEVFVCLATVLFWIAAPEDFLLRLYGLEGPGAYFLLQQSGNVIFCVYVYFYWRILRSEPFDLRAFRWLQEAMAIGDVIILASAPLLWMKLQPALDLFIAQHVMAALWLGIRLVYLWGHGSPSRLLSAQPFTE